LIKTDIEDERQARSYYQACPGDGSGRGLGEGTQFLRVTTKQSMAVLTETFRIITSNADTPEYV
jgi:hypothetical protein